MTISIFLSQRTNRHIVKKLDSSYVYTSSFGTFGTAKTDNTGLSNPIGIAADISNNIYICDSKNKRIVKLDSSLTYVNSLDVSTVLGEPFSILYDSSGDLYAIGIYRNISLSIARITTGLVISKSNNNICSPVNNLCYICRGFSSNDFIISFDNKLVKVIESTSFSAAVSQSIVGITNALFTGIIKHSNGSLYVCQNTSSDKGKISRINSSYFNTGDSDIISKYVGCLKEATDGSLLVCDTWNQKIIRYSELLNYVEDVYVDSGDLISTDAYETSGILELNI
jgi:hypothetical protein